MKLQINKCMWLRFHKYLVYLSVLIFTGCAGVNQPPPSASASEDQSLDPSYTVYTNGISCKQVGQLLIMENGRENLGLMVGAFMTGVNYQKKRVSSATVSQLVASVNWYCKNHPKATVTKALIALDRDIDDGFESVPSSEEQSKSLAKSNRKKVKKITYKTAPVAEKPAKVATNTKTAVKPGGTRKSVVLPKADPDGTHVVQVMSSQDVAEAKKMAAKLKAKGLPTFVTTADLGSNGTWHRVLIGPYKDNTSAKQVAALLEKFNYKAFVRQR